jgi:hypothetical protein
MSILGHACIAFLPVLLCGAVGCSRPNVQPGITRVWAVDDGEKVKQDVLDHWAAASAENTVWDGQRIRVFGGKNEVVAFQVILEAAGTGAEQVNVVLDTLRNGPAVIANQGSAEDSFGVVGRRIELFVEHYQNITQRSIFGGSNGFAEARPLPDDLHLGFIPDALIPFEAPVKTPAHGPGGAPFSIGAGRTQAVWVDIYIPKDARTGTYAGTLVVSERGEVRFRLPLELEVYGFTLPDETHQRSFFHWNEEFLPHRYGIPSNTREYWAMFHKFMMMAHRHRMDLVDGRRVLLGEAGFVKNLGGYYTGSNFTVACGYDGPGSAVGSRTYSIGTYDQPHHGWVSGFFPNTETAWREAADAWEGWFIANAPSTLRFKYMDDEADVKNPDVVRVIKDKCRWITSGFGPGKDLHRFFTKEFVFDGFLGSIDLWGLNGHPGIRSTELRERTTSHGELFCMYNGTRPMWGQMEIIDNFATDNRVNSWIAWKYGVGLLFLWETSFYAEDTVPHPNAVNVWRANYLPGGEPYGSLKTWGAGMWFYPGRDIEYPEDDRGVNGPISCIRMKNFRRGQQDYEYLWLAARAQIEVRDVVDRIVPRALDDWGESEYADPPGYFQQPTYPTRGFVYEAARRALAERLARAGIRGAHSPDPQDTSAPSASSGHDSLQ